MKESIRNSQISKDFLMKNHVDEIVNSFAGVSELYSVVVDINGHTLVEPTGPATYLGEFHEIILNPKYSKLYADTVNCLIDSKQAMYSEIDDGNPDSRFAAAPIFVKGTFYATWILYAHNKSQNQRLFKTFDHMSSVAKSLSDVITRLYEDSIIAGEEEEIKTEYVFEHGAKDIMNNALDAIYSGDRSSIFKLYDQVGELLDVDYMVYYAIDTDRPGYMKLVDYWAKNGKGKEAESKFAWDSDHYDIEIQNKIKKDCLVVDKSNMTNKMRVEVFQGNVKAIMVFPVYIRDQYQGRLIFIENTKERVWTECEIAFGRELTSMLARATAIQMRLYRGNKNIKLFTELFDILPEYIFVRRRIDGTVIYMNSALKNKLGSDMIGQNSYRLIPNTREGLEDIRTTQALPLGVDKELFTRYIDMLGGNFKVAQFNMRWKNLEKVEILILTPES